MSDMLYLDENENLQYLNRSSAYVSLGCPGPSYEHGIRASDYALMNTMGWRYRNNRYYERYITQEDLDEFHKGFWSDSYQELYGDDYLENVLPTIFSQVVQEWGVVLGRDPETRTCDCCPGPYSFHLHTAARQPDRDTLRSSTPYDKIEILMFDS